MDPTAPAADAAHAGHDELLIARLYGGDVDGVERARALDLLAECRECAALFADFGAIAAASVAVPVPARPRDFSLTEADAARLRRRRPGLQTVFGAGLRRSLGSSLAALGLVGVLATGALSLLGGPAATLSSNAATRDQGVAVVPAAPEASAAGGIGKSAPTAGPVSVVAPDASGFAFGPPGSPPATSTAAPEASPHDVATAAAAGVPDSGATVMAPPGPQYSTPSAGSELAVTNGGTGSQAAVTESASQGGMDARLVWIGGFGLLFAAGLLIVFLPLRPRGRRRGSLP